MINPAVDESVVTVRYLFCILPILMATIHCIWRRNLPGFSKVDCFLTYFLTIGVGLQSLLVGHLEIYHGDIVAQYIGWPNSPFLSELGKANIAFGVMGILSFWVRSGWREATALGYALFVLMSGLGHYRYIIFSSHTHQGILGPIITTNFIIAGCLFFLLAARRFLKK